MATTTTNTEGRYSWRRQPLRLLFAGGSVLLLAFLGLKLYLATPLPATQLSRYLSAYLKQPFSVSEVRLSGTTLVLKHLRLGNPAGFPRGELAAADSVAIAPCWLDLARGASRFRLVSLQGIRIELVKNGQGVWNYAQLQRTLAARKPSATESYLHELLVKDGSLSVQGEGARGIDLRVYDLTSKGSLDSALELAFRDAATNRYTLKGKARGGSEPALDLTLTAPYLSLPATASMLKLKKPELFAGGKGALRLDASLHKGLLSASGELAFAGLKSGKGVPIAGALRLAGDYRLVSDVARVTAATLAVDKLLKLHAQGAVQGMKRQRDFLFLLDSDEAELSALEFLFPELHRNQITLTGRLRLEQLRLKGSGAAGLADATGRLALRDVAVTRAGRKLVAGAAATAAVSRNKEGVGVTGSVSVRGAHDAALLQGLDLPFSAVLSPRLKPLAMRVPAFSARVGGVPLTGSAAFDAGAANPVAATVKLPAARMAQFKPLLDRLGVQAEAGNVAGDLQLAGKNLQELKATASLQLTEVSGRRGKDSFAVKTGTLTGNVVRIGGAKAATAQGEARVEGLTWNGKKGNARFGYRLADRILSLDAGALDFGGAKVSFAGLSGTLPVVTRVPAGSRLPLAVDLKDVAVTQGDLKVEGMTGRWRGSYNSDHAGKWLDGTADLASSALLWRGRRIAAPTLHAAFDRAGGRAEVSGRLLAGKVSGTAAYNPFAAQPAAAFDLQVTGAELPALAAFLPKGATTPSAGTADVRMSGSYAGVKGFSWRLSGEGKDLSLVGKGGRTLVAGAGVSVAGGVADGDLTLERCVLTPGPGVELSLTGKLARAFTPKRQGALAFSLPTAGLKGLVAAFINVVPRFLQEGAVSGSAAAHGSVEFSQGRSLLAGSLDLKAGRVEVASQKLLIDGLDGRIPFSLDLSGRTEAKLPKGIDFSRENYPQLLQQLRGTAAGGERLAIGRIAFGGIQLDNVDLRLRADKGVTEITSLHADLFKGTLLGKGVVTVQEKLFYRGDLLVGGLSLRTICSRFADIQGYISGLVDGVLSLSGGSGLDGITGFTELWARKVPGEKMLVSKEFLQRLSKQKLSGFFFRSDRPYDRAEIKAILEEGDLTFETLSILHTNLFGVRDLNVSIAPAQNRIALEHLLSSIKEAVVRGKPSTGKGPAPSPGPPPAELPAEPAPEFKWEE